MEILSYLAVFSFSHFHKIAENILLIPFFVYESQIFYSGEMLHAILIIMSHKYYRLRLLIGPGQYVLTFILIAEILHSL